MILTSEKSPYIENAIILEDFVYSAKINIPSLMPFIKKTNPKEFNYNVNTSNIANDDASFFTGVEKLKMTNYYQIDNVGEGFKDGNILISFVSEDINNIITLSL